MKIFTIENGKVTPGVRVGKSTRYDGSKEHGVFIGKDGAIGEMVTMRVHLIGLGYKQYRIQYRKWEQDDCTLNFASVIRGENGKPELWAELGVNNTEKDNAICVFHTRLGSSDTNSHTGDIIRKNIYGNYDYADFPGSVLCRVNISKERYGEQMIAVMESDCVFRTSYPSESKASFGEIEGESHFYRWEPRRSTLHGGYSIIGRKHEAVFDKYVNINHLV